MIRIGRRSLLAGLGMTAAALGLRPRRAEARIAARRDAAGVSRWLVDASLAPRDLAALPVESPTRLDADLVQQWRAGLREALQGERNGAIALVRWDKAQVLHGLAREAGMQARIERQSPAVFRVTLVTRA